MSATLPQAQPEDSLMMPASSVSRRLMKAATG